MNTTTWTMAPADLLGLGGAAVCPVRRSRPAAPSSASARAPRVAPFQGTGVPAGGIAARLRPEPSRLDRRSRRTVAHTIAHNSIGTTLGIHPSGRPLS